MPKGGSCAMLPVSAGVADDLSRFLRAFIASRKYQHADFKELFKKMNMITMFNGRDYSAEICEFNESLLAECVIYLEPYSSPQVKRCFEERLFGLYTIHTFFYLQQMDHVMKIRMDPDIYQHFNCFVEQLRIEGYLDAFACGAQLKRDKAFKIVAFVGYHDPVYHRSFDTETNVKKLPAAVNLDVPFANLRNLLRSDQFLLLDAMHEKYEEKKRELGIKFDVPLENPVRVMEKDLEKLESEYYEKDRVKNVVEETATICDPNRDRSTIKHEAYTSNVNFSRTRRHRDAEAVHNPSQMFDFINNNEKEPEENRGTKRRAEKPARKWRKSETLMDLAAEAGFGEENEEKPEISDQGAEIPAKKSKKARNSSPEPENLDEKPDIWPEIPPESPRRSSRILRNAAGKSGPEAGKLKNSSKSGLEVDEKPEISQNVAGKSKIAQKSGRPRKVAEKSGKAQKSSPEADEKPEKSPEAEILDQKSEAPEKSGKPRKNAGNLKKARKPGSKAENSDEKPEFETGKAENHRKPAGNSKISRKSAPEIENSEDKPEVPQNSSKSTKEAENLEEKPEIPENLAEVKQEIEEPQNFDFEVKLEIVENEEAEYPGILKKNSSIFSQIRNRSKSVQFSDIPEIREFEIPPKEEEIEYSEEVEENDSAQLSPEYAEDDDCDFEGIPQNPSEENQDLHENPGKNDEIGLKIDELRDPKIEEDSSIFRFRASSELNDWFADDDSD